MSEGPEVSVIVPAYNEAANLPRLLEELQQLDGGKTEIIVVDDGSRDQTAQVAQARGATVVRLPGNQGKGSALKAGFVVARGQFLVQIDADRQFLTNEIPKLLAPLRNGADVVFGSRFARGASLEPGSMEWTNRIAHKVICF